MRAAYAACLLPDATGILCAMLRATSGLNAFNECLYNGAPFDESVISRAVLDRVKRLGDYAVTYEASQVKVKLKEGFAHYASYSFLQTLFQAATVARTDDGDAVAFSVMRDAVNRGIRMPREILAGRLREVYDKQAYYFVDISTEASSQKFRLSDVIQHT